MATNDRPADLEEERDERAVKRPRVDDGAAGLIGKHELLRLLMYRYNSLRTTGSGAVERDEDEEEDVYGAFGEQESGRASDLYLDTVRNTFSLMRKEY